MYNVDVDGVETLKYVKSYTANSNDEIVTIHVAYTSSPIEEVHELTYENRNMVSQSVSVMSGDLVSCYSLEYTYDNSVNTHRSYQHFISDIVNIDAFSQNNRITFKRNYGCDVDSETNFGLRYEYAEQGQLSKLITKNVFGQSMYNSTEFLCED